MKTCTGYLIKQTTSGTHTAYMHPPNGYQHPDGPSESLRLGWASFTEAERVMLEQLEFDLEAGILKRVYTVVRITVTEDPVKSASVDDLDDVGLDIKERTDKNPEFERLLTHAKAKRGKHKTWG